MSEPTTPLARTLGLTTTTLMGVGVILGAGIYALVGKAAGLAGEAVWLSFVAAAVAAALTGLSYAELSGLIPRAGGEYHYARRAFGPLAAFMTSWLLLGGLTVASAAVALGFAGYLGALYPVPMPVGLLGILLLSAAVLSWGTKESAGLAIAGTLLEVIGLIVVIAVGLPELGEVDLTAMPHGAGGVVAAATLIFFAYIGFEEIVQLAEETHDPGRTLPRALLLSIAITSVLYVLVALAAVAVLGAEALGSSDSPLADVVEAAVGWKASAAIAVVALFSTGNTVLLLVMSSARLLYGMAEDGALPRALAHVHPGRRTPIRATLLIAALAAGTALAFERIEVVAELTNLALFATFVVMNLAVIALRFREPDAPRPFRIPGAIGRVPVVPVLGIVSVLALAVQTGVGALGAGAILLGAGGVVFAMGRRGSLSDG